MAKRKHRKKSVPARLGERPTAERCKQHGGVVAEVVDRDASGNVYVLRYRAKMECMLDAYLIKGLIEREAHEAGMRYRIAWLRAREGLQISDRFNSGAAVLSYEESLDIIPQSEKYLKEADTVLSVAQRKIIIRVCCDDKRAGGTDSLETLRRGLKRLVKCWRMA